MPPIYYLNPPPNPFWDFVAGVEDHPFFAQHRRPVPQTPPPHPPRPATEQAQTQAAHTGTAPEESSEKARGKQPEANVEDPPEVDPSTVRSDGKPQEGGMPFRGRGRFSKAFEGNENDTPGDNDCRRRRGRPCHGPRAWGGPSFGPPPFLFGPNHPFFGRQGPPGHGGPEGRGPGGPGGPGGPFPGRHGPHRHGHHGAHARSPPRGGPFGRPGQESGFDLSAFLNNLGERLGVDLSAAAEGLGLKSHRNDADFEPRTDIFDTASAYTIHLSLPGAKKSDVRVDWDGEHSILRIAGVVHRPNVDEEMMSRLIVDGRKRETGVFEKSIRLGTSKDPATVDVSGITAKMVDGVLIVRVPKVEKKFEKKEVRVDGASPERPEDAYMNEKDLLFDAEADEDMYDAEPPQTYAPTKETPGETAKDKEQQAASEEQEARDDRSETVGFETQDQRTDTLPQYTVQDDNTHQDHHHTHSTHEDDMSDWEKAGSEDEGEYVKINVD